MKLLNVKFVAVFSTFFVLTYCNLTDLSGKIRPVLLPDTLKGQENTTELKLNNNNFTKIYPESFDNVKYLKKLNLSYNSISDLPENIFNKNIYLTTLDLQNNKLAVLNNSNLFKENKLIEAIYLNDNDISILGNIFPTSVKILFLQNNTIDKFTPNVFGTLEILTLDLSQNLIKQINKASFNKNIKAIQLRHNKIENIADVFRDLPNLNDLDISHNKLNKLNDDDFVGLVSLKNLFINNNELENIPKGIFSNLPELVEINLSYNRIKTLDNGLFTSNVVLIKIYLDSNKITQLSENLLGKSVKHMDLRNNSIDTISDKLFNNITSMTYLDLSINKLTQLNPIISQQLIKIPTLILEKNPWLCTCDTFKTIKVLRTVSTDVECKDGRKWKDLQENEVCRKSNVQAGKTEEGGSTVSKKIEFPIEQSTDEKAKTGKNKEKDSTVNKLQSFIPKSTSVITEKAKNSGKSIVAIQDAANYVFFVTGFIYLRYL